ncbi:hypothetical protein GCM10023340_40800 [Nocardioides marinquilinus]|uniref:Uncharacterized protein n=1 Tax=Nocardioides marinquilinus TaxID=1210400 RepID=A0ABP9Q6D4_9ACTN
MTRLLPSRPRGRAIAVAVVVGVALVLVSPLFGRAAVTGMYRPVLPGDGLTSGCYPLPGGAQLDFPYVLRSDSDVLDAHGLHRRVVLHYDRVDGAEAVARAEAAFEAAGVADRVGVSARDFDVPDDYVIRGEMVLDLPLTGRESDDPDCENLFVTKRFTPDLPDRS